MTSRDVPGHTSDGMELMGYHDLDGRPAFKLALQAVEGRWYLFATHFWESRLSVIDVTDPADMRIVASLEGPDKSATWQVQVAEGLLVQGIEHRPPAWGGDPDHPGDEGIRLWDVSDPRSPKLLSHWRTGAHGVHRNHYTGGRYVHVTAGKPGYEGNIYVVLDIDDPRHPTEVGRWFLPEQFVAAGTSPVRRISLHGPPYVVGDRAYLSYGAAGVVILDVSDPTTPVLVSRLDIGAAFSSRIAMHTAVPVPERHLLLVNTEAIAELAEEPYNFAGVVDIRDESEPRLLSLLPLPAPAPDAPYPNFSRRGGRFGPHNQHHPQSSADLYQSDHLVFMTWFNAGVRVFDTSDPYLPREIAWYLPDDPTERRGMLPKTLVTQSEDILVDARGTVFFTDKNHGIHAVRLRSRR
ncbi:MAG: LVIVD repeat-containing protein [Nocardioidaceae bacterium]